MEDAKGRRFAFVNFEKPEDAKKAVEMFHGKDLRSDEQKEADKEKEEEEKEKVRYMAKMIAKMKYD